MIIKWLTISTVIVFMFALFAKVFHDSNYFKINRVEFHSDKIPEGSEIKILQISDLHNKVFGNKHIKLLSTVEKLNPNIIVITGDLIDRRTDEFNSVFYLVDQLKAQNENVFFVSGNHEWDNAHTEKFFSGLRERNVRILDNDNIKIARGKVIYNLVGVADSSTNHENIKQSVKGINRELYTVMLSHSPSVVEKYKDDIPADLILSGHTHGGQVRLPLVGAVVAPDQGLFPKFDKGTYRLKDKDKDNQFLYIDSGLGTSVLPIRFLNQSQLTLITLTNTKTKY